MNQPKAGSSSLPAESLVEAALIHAPGSIQPHGVLLVLDEPEFLIIQVSRNTEEYLGVSPQQLLGQSLRDLLDPLQIQVLLQHLPEANNERIPLGLAITVQDQSVSFQGGLFRAQEALVLELEPALTAATEDSTDVQMRLSGAIARMKRAASLGELLTTIVDEVQQLTNFDRVHLYQFDDQAAGEVVAEAKRDTLPSYLGLHFPAHDIPAQARELYALGQLRNIPDLMAQSVPLMPTLNPKTEQPLDLSRALLRSVDPCCVEYHQNMGSAALVIAAIVKEQTLWGLLACHHQTAKYLSYPIRTACGLLTQIAASEIENKLRQADLARQTQLHALQSEFLHSIAEADNFIDALIKPEIRLLSLVGAQGAAVCLGDDITLLGHTPSLDHTRQLIEWADQTVTDTLFHTDSLARVYPDAEAFTAIASGLLFLRISKVQRYGIFWFRPEVLQTVNWGGNPEPDMQLDADGQPILCPRNSFTSWQEIVRHTSLPWHPFEISGALDLRNAIVGIVLKKADELAKLNYELQRSNKQLASFAYAAAHDLKEPLRGIYNYANILLEDYTQVLDVEGVDYLTEIQGFSQRMETLINALLRVAQLRQTALQLQSTDLNVLLEDAVEVVQASRSDDSFDLRAPQSLPCIDCDPVLVNEVFRNLISNAIKYNNQAEKWVEVGFQPTSSEVAADSPRATAANWVFYVRDNGIGIPKIHLSSVFQLFKRLHPQEYYGGGAGVGLAIVHQIIERHGGQIWTESVEEEGSTFYFTLGG